MSSAKTCDARADALDRATELDDGRNATRAEKRVAALLQQVTDYDEVARLESMVAQRRRELHQLKRLRRIDAFVAAGVGSEWVLPGYGLLGLGRSKDLDSELGRDIAGRLALDAVTIADYFGGSTRVMQFAIAVWRVGK